MSSDVSFSMDAGAGEEILTNLAMPVIQKSADAIVARANQLAGSMSTDPPEITVSSAFGTIKKGTRAIATIKVVPSGDPHKNYIGLMALSKSKDAGRV